ncbi:hypothetical protein chiPu_0024736, partial [Chiloscyllium punctatum]|nr:hypothetical protein [Chiloscyllium punctatum]
MAAATSTRRCVRPLGILGLVVLEFWASLRMCGIVPSPPRERSAVSGLLLQCS